VGQGDCHLFIPAEMHIVTSHVQALSAFLRALKTCLLSGVGAIVTVGATILSGGPTNPVGVLSSIGAVATVGLAIYSGVEVYNDYNDWQDAEEVLPLLWADISPLSMNSP